MPAVAGSVPGMAAAEAGMLVSAEPNEMLSSVTGSGKCIEANTCVLDSAGPSGVDISRVMSRACSLASWSRQQQPPSVTGLQQLAGSP